MFQRRPLPWSLEEYRPLSFSVAVLVEDGLRVAPFDRHPDGSAQLRAIGLDRSGWLAWFHAIIAQPRRLRLDMDPSILWVGNQEVRERLHDLWLGYPQGQSADFIESLQSLRLNGAREAREVQRLVRSAQVVGARMQAYWVAYPVLVSYRASETTVVIGSPVPPSFTELMRHIAHPGERGGESLAFSGG